MDAGSSAVEGESRGRAAVTEADAGTAVEPGAGDGPRTVSVTFSGNELLVELLDNPTADDLWDSLPMTLEFSDFSGMEKIGYPEEELALEGSPSSCEPEAGDLCVYGPWGNLSFFYRDFRHSEGLVPVGTTVSGMELIEEITEGELLTFERL